MDPSKEDSLNRPNPSASLSRVGEAIGAAGLGALLVFFLAISWRRWPDPVIDFGRELYLPWRLSHGAVLYRDVDDVYGPLTQYFNAALFSVFGPGLMVLVAANIMILIGIVASAYVLFRRAWGPGAALFGNAFFIAVFAASQFSDTGNFNFITPYSEETTHGLFVCLVLIFVLIRWVENRTPAGSFLAGLLFGLTLIQKPEIALAGGLLIITAIWSRTRTPTPVRWQDFARIGLGALLPTVIFFAFFAVSLPLSDAVSAAGRAWLNALTTTRFSNYNLELGFIGLDRPWINFRNEFLATLTAALLFSGLGIAAWFLEKTGRRWLYFIALGLLVIALFWISLHVINWVRAARCLPGLTLIYLIIIAAQIFLRGATRETVPRLLLAVLALALLARMLLHARIFDYGYYQAALAAMMVPAILLVEAPRWLHLGPRGKGAIAAALLAFFLPGVVTLDALSYQNLRVKTVPVGTGRDRFYSSRLDATGLLVDSVSAALRAGPRTSTALVLPEGVMINYLARLPSPIAPYFYYAAATANGREDQIVADLRSHPPDVVVIISRPLFEYGIVRYGSETDEGRQILAWVKRNYVPAFARGGNPLDVTTRGVMVLTPGPEASFQ